MRIEIEFESQPCHLLSSKLGGFPSVYEKQKTCIPAGLNTLVFGDGYCTRIIGWLGSLDLNDYTQV